MPYWVYVKQSEAGSWEPVRSFSHENAAWLYVEKMEHDWRTQVGKVPHYKVCYGTMDVPRK
jgi:hypothetical protein